MDYGISCLAAAGIAFAVSAVTGKFLIPFLRKLKFGQTIKEIGPVWHKDKQGTPNMGGWMFIAGTGAGIAAGALLILMGNGEGLGLAGQGVKLFAGFLMAFAFGFIGFLDDYVKDVKKQNAGLTPSQKLLLQLIVAAGYFLTLSLTGSSSTVLVLPFIGQFDLGYFYYPLMLFVILGTVNAVNLTDGIDGLAGSVTFVAGICILVIAGILRIAGAAVYASALTGALLGFLIYNFHPAKVFMGDTGSMFLGGSVAALAFGLNLPVLILFFGIVYFIEALSVILQVLSFKLTGRRIFKMSPIHHHFEMCGWSEGKIVGVFSLVTLAGGILSAVMACRI